MSIVHLEQLRNTLEKNHWKVCGELPGNDYEISALWKISRPDGSARLTIAFQGLDDMDTLPVEKSYGCWVLEKPTISAYFSRKNRSWPSELERFVRDLNAIII